MASPRPTVATIIAAAVTAGLAVASPTPAGAAPTAPSTAASSRSNAMIVLLRNQHSNLSFTGTRSPRAAAVAADQAGVIKEASGLGATRIHGFRIINAFSARLTSAQAASLSRDPKVAAVVPDLAIKAPAAARTLTASPKVTRQAAGGSCPSNPAHPLLEPEALHVINDASGNPKAPAATRLVTGRGVTVGFMADGVDPNNPEFIRPNGQHVFVDYQDFSGEGPYAPSSAAEAFGDASSIAAQGNKVYDLHDFGNAQPIPAGCTIRVKGTAPGVSLVGLKVFGGAPTAPTSRFIDAIDYAVRVAQVDVLNQSFGANPYPDNGNDPISLADRMAVAAGVTVVASTGDAGTSGTTGSPSTNSAVIGVAATTTYRLYQQTGFGGANFSNGRWLNNNISGLSSGGVSQGARVPDIAAPGDEGWAVCTPDPKIYEDCLDNLGKPTNLLQFGGTSQSSPFTAGVAALVIQAYRRSHGGATPTPDLVKRLLMSTATDLGHPASEQGAGLVNALAAVNAATSVPSSAGTPDELRGANLVLSKSQVSLVGNTGTKATTTVFVRNVSGRNETITPTVRSLAAEKGFASGKLPINTDTSAVYTDPFGIDRAYIRKSFVLKGSHARLVVRAAASAAPGGALRIILIDPKGRLAYYTIPQGSSNYALAEVRRPVAGTWRAYFAFGRAAHFHGYVNYRAATQEFVTTRSVSPASKKVAPGAVARFQVTATLPSRPGDASDSVQFRTSHGRTVSMPLTLRSVVPARATTFSGTITGGNGRQVLPAQANSYYIDVPAKKAALNVDLRFGDDNTLVVGVLVGPNGQVYSFKSNGDTSDTAGFNLFARNPQPGRWVLTLAVANPVSGRFIAYPFTAKVGYSTVKVASDLPNSTDMTLPQGVAATIPVKITNNDARNSLSLFSDARTNRTGDIPLPQLNPDSTTFDLPAAPEVAPTWLVPTEVDRADFVITGSTPVNWDVYFTSGEPEIYTGSTAVGDDFVADARAQASQVSPGFWTGDVGQPGPFTKAPQKGTATVSATAHGKLFDTRVTSSTGDFWTDGPTTRDKTGAITGGVDPLSLLPGEAGTINLTITPTGNPGDVVRGTVYIDSYDDFLGSGDELIALPYSYTVGAAPSHG